AAQASLKSIETVLRLRKEVEEANAVWQLNALGALEQRLAASDATLHPEPISLLRGEVDRICDLARRLDGMRTKVKALNGEKAAGDIAETFATVAVKFGAGRDAGELEDLLAQIAPMIDEIAVAVH